MAIYDYSHRNRWMDRMVWDGDAMRWMVLPPLQALLISLWHSNATKASEDELNKGRGNGAATGFLHYGSLKCFCLWMSTRPDFSAIASKPLSACSKVGTRGAVGKHS